MPVRAQGETKGERRAVPGAIREIVPSMDPLPASLIDSRFAILMSHDASEELSWAWHSLPCIHKNQLWCCITKPARPGQVPEYGTHVRSLVARRRGRLKMPAEDPG